MLRIDIPAVLASKMPGKHIPGFIVRYLQRIAHEQEMNDYLAAHGHEVDYEFARSFLIGELGCKTELIGAEHLPQTDEPLLFVSNHPLGGLDGLFLLLTLHEQRGKRVRAIVNDLLMHMTPLQGLFVPVNKLGAQNADYAIKHRALWESSDDVLTFPAGLCSRWNEHNEVVDKEWKASFVRNAIQHKRMVVPIYFEGENSKRFYRLSKWRTRLGLPNIEMLYLVDEMYRGRGKTFRIHVGEPIPYSHFDSTRPYAAWAEYVKQQVYSMRPKCDK